LAKIPADRENALRTITLRHLQKERKKGSKLVRSCRVLGRATVAGKTVDIVEGSYHYELRDGDLETGEEGLWFFVGNATRPSGRLTIGHPGVSGSSGTWTVFSTRDNSALYAVTWEVGDGSMGVSDFRIVKVDAGGKPHVVARPLVRGKKYVEDHLMWAARCGEQTFVCLWNVAQGKDRRDYLYRVTPKGFEKVSRTERRALEKR
jgi:hypothetical protein